MQNILGRKKLNNFVAPLVVATVAFLLIVSRRITSITNPQFWGEDKFWYQDAYAFGAFSALFRPMAGYYLTFSRIVGGIAQIFPLHDAPLIFNLSGITSEIAVVFYLASKRLAQIVPNIWMRLFLGFIVIAAPHSGEIHASLTNAQWYLAILSFLITVSPPAQSLAWKIFDITVLILSAFNGPFCLFLVMVAIIFWLVKRYRQTLIVIAIMALAAIVQVVTLLHSPRVAQGVKIERSVNYLASIVGGQIGFSGIFGVNYYASFDAYRFTAAVAAIPFLVIIIAYTLITARLELKLFILYAGAVFAGSLMSTDWVALAFPLIGDRYWFIPITCYLFALTYCAFAAKHLIFRILGSVLLLLSLFGMFNDWVYPPFEDLNFQQNAREFENAPSGTEMKIPTLPNWELNLKKH